MLQQALTIEITNAEYTERPGTRLLVPGPVAAEPDPRHVAANVDGIADAAELAPHRAADHQEQGHAPVAGSSR